MAGGGSALITALWRGQAGLGREEDAGAPRLPAVGTNPRLHRGRCARAVRPGPLILRPPLSQHLSHPVSGLTFYASKWMGITMKIYVCSERGWFPSVGSRDRCFPIPFFICALGRAVERGGSVSARRRRADHRAPEAPGRTVRKAASASPPAGPEPPPLLGPRFVSPGAHPCAARPLTSGTGPLPCPPLPPPGQSLGLRKRPFP